MSSEKNDPKEAATGDDKDKGPARAERARAALIAAIDAQLKANDPPETMATLVRLMEAGHPREAALKLIASALIAEVTNVLRENSQYDRERYVTNLKKLPKLPWDKTAAPDGKQ